MVKKFMKTENSFYENVIIPLFLLLDPEKSHNLVIKSLSFISYIPFLKKIISEIAGDFKDEVMVNGVKFKNKLGLAAGFDKNAEAYDVISELGFGFIEIGTVTLNPQKGNPRPRLWRIPENKAILNRMGFNNYGARIVAKNIEKKGKIKIPLGINIGKNTDCSIEEAHKNYSECFRILKDLGDYFVINVSCPNIKDLKKLQNSDFLKKILDSILKIAERKFFLKISPELSNENLNEIIKICLDYKIGLIAVNTTTDKSLLPLKWKSEEGGLSGVPLSTLAKNKLREIRKISKDIPLISCGGVFSKEDFIDRISLGADLVQIYTSIIYKGPFIVKKILSK